MFNTNEIKIKWMKGRLDDGVHAIAAGHEFDEWFWNELDKAAKQERSRIRRKIVDSFDHANDEWSHDSYMDGDRFAEQEGYRHRDKQVMTVLDLMED